VVRYIGLIIIFLATTSLGVSENKAYEMKRSPALQFMTHLFDTMHRVSPKQKEAFDNYEKVLLESLKKVKKLDRDYHKAKSKGLKGTDSKESLKKEAKIVLNDALQKTENYLIQLSEGIKNERKMIIDDLLPQENK